jgi:protein-tyrosine phosphatase
LMPLLFKRDVYAGVLDMVDGVYADTVDHSCPQLAALFTLMQRPEVYPVLIYCRAGRDRTGFISAVIQLALGVGTEDVLQDYLRSNAYLLPQARRTLAALRIISLGLFPAENLRAVFASQERYMRTVIGKIEGEYGGIAAYLGRCGIDVRKIETLKALLVE